MPAENATEHPSSSQRWVLAFDASCGTCREISGAVAHACEGKLEVLPLTHPEVRRWLGTEAPHEPTLLRIRGAEAVGVRTGKRMALALVRRIGVRSTFRVLNALGRLRQEVEEPLAEPREPRLVSRQRFLRIGSGVAVAGGMLLSGTAPAFAAERERAAAKWVAEHAHQLPRTYSEIIKYSWPYRREIYHRLPVATRAELWREQLARYRAEHPGLSAERDGVLRRLESVCDDAANFEFAGPGQSAARRADEELRAEVVRAFGRDEARGLVATLGPVPKPSEVGAAQAECACSTQSDWCQENYCYGGGCTWLPAGCGLWMRYPCDGTCYPPA